jgi:hypothetical protein
MASSMCFKGLLAVLEGGGDFDAGAVLVAISAVIAELLLLLLLLFSASLSDLFRGSGDLSYELANDS